MCVDVRSCPGMDMKVHRGYMDAQARHGRFGKEKYVKVRRDRDVRYT